MGIYDVVYSKLGPQNGCSIAYIYDIKLPNRGKDTYTILIHVAYTYAVGILIMNIVRGGVQTQLEWIQDIRLTAYVAGQHGMLTPPRHLVPPLVCPGVRVCPSLDLVFSIGNMRMVTIPYLHLFILHIYHNVGFQIIMIRMVPILIQLHTVYITKSILKQ